MHNLDLFIEKVHNCAYDPALVRRESHRRFPFHVLYAPPDVGLCLTNVVRRTAEWPPETVDPTPLFLIISTLIENNPTQTRVRFN